MSNLFILNEAFANNLSYNFLNVTIFVSVICGILVIISKNPVVSVLFLIGLFLNIAGYLMMLGINFIGMSYLLVYVGAVLILFMFVFLLISIISEEVEDNNNIIPIAVMLGLIRVTTSHPHWGILTLYILLFTLLVFLCLLSVLSSHSVLLSRKIREVYSYFEWCLHSPPKPHAFSSTSMQSVSNIWLTLFGAGPVLYLLSSGPVYAADASQALGVKWEALGCLYGNGIHRGEIISITILDRGWYGFEQCTFVMHCAQCHLEATLGPVSSILVKMQQLKDVAGA